MMMLNTNVPHLWCKELLKEKEFFLLPPTRPHPAVKKAIKCLEFYRDKKRMLAALQEETEICWPSWFHMQGPDDKVWAAKMAVCRLLQLAGYIKQRSTQKNGSDDITRRNFLFTLSKQLTAGKDSGPPCARPHDPKWTFLTHQIMLCALQLHQKQIHCHLRALQPISVWPMSNKIVQQMWQWLIVSTYEEIV